MGNDSLEKVFSDSLKNALEESCGVSLEILKQYAEAHKAGKALVIPCKEGDTLYVLTNHSQNGIVETKCKSVLVYGRNGVSRAKVIAPVDLHDLSGAIWEFYPEDFGKTVFDDRGVAEEMLQFRKNSIALQEKFAKEMGGLFSNMHGACLSQAHLSDR